MKNKKKNIIGVIPARMNSTRFPGKALQDIHGTPMLGHVYQRSKLSKVLDEVYLAVGGKEIEDYADSIGAKWVPDREEGYRGCVDAVADTVSKIEKQTNQVFDIVVLIQGDEPMIVPEMIDMAVEPMLNDDSIKVVNLMAPIETDKEHEDPNCPKVVVDQYNNALFFSREPIPTRKKKSDGLIPKLKQVCIIPFTRKYLSEYSQLKPTPLEEAELIDMNRVLEYGDKVKMVYEEYETQAVDTPKDIEKVRELMKDDELISRYGKN